MINSAISRLTCSRPTLLCSAFCCISRAPTLTLFPSFKSLKLDHIASHGLLLTWEGADPSLAPISKRQIQLVSYVFSVFHLIIVLMAHQVYTLSTCGARNLTSPHRIPSPSQKTQSNAGLIHHSKATSTRKGGFGDAVRFSLSYPRIFNDHSARRRRLQKSLDRRVERRR